MYVCLIFSQNYKKIGTESPTTYKKVKLPTKSIVGDKTFRTVVATISKYFRQFFR